MLGHKILQPSRELPKSSLWRGQMFMTTKGSKLESVTKGTYGNKCSTFSLQNCGKKTKHCHELGSRETAQIEE